MPKYDDIPSHNSTDEQAALWLMRTQDSDFTSEDQRQLNEWLSKSEANKKAYIAMQEVWGISSGLAGDTPNPSKTMPTEKRWLFTRHSIFGKPAAAFVLLPLIVVIGWQSNLLPNSYSHYSSEDSITSITLPDQSQVTLNHYTQLSYLNYKKTRKVLLNNGEAFFRISKDKDKPLVVDAGPADIIVTGTQFNVWRHNKNVVVSLTEGSVEVLNGDNEVKLKPGYEASVKSNQAIQVDMFEKEQILAWQEHSLIFNNISLNDAIDRINNYTDRPIEVKGDIKNLRIGGIYKTNDIDNLIENLPKIVPIKLSYADPDKIILSIKTHQ